MTTAETQHARSGRFGQAWRGFRRWRRARPFWGGLFTALAGLEIFGTTQMSLGGLTFQMGPTGFLSWLIPVILFACGMLMWFSPQQRLFYAIVAAVTAVHSAHRGEPRRLLPRPAVRHGGQRPRLRLGARQDPAGRRHPRRAGRRDRTGRRLPGRRRPARARRRAAAAAAGGGGHRPPHRRAARAAQPAAGAGADGVGAPSGRRHHAGAAGGRPRRHPGIRAPRPEAVRDPAGARQRLHDRPVRAAQRGAGARRPGGLPDRDSHQGRAEPDGLRLGQPDPDPPPRPRTATC